MILCSSIILIYGCTNSGRDCTASYLVASDEAVSLSFIARLLLLTLYTFDMQFLCSEEFLIGTQSSNSIMTLSSWSVCSRNNFRPLIVDEFYYYHYKYYSLFGQFFQFLSSPPSSNRVSAGLFPPPHIHFRLSFVHADLILSFVRLSSQTTPCKLCTLSRNGRAARSKEYGVGGGGSRNDHSLPAVTGTSLWLRKRFSANKGSLDRQAGRERQSNK